MKRIVLSSFVALTVILTIGCRKEEAPDYSSKIVGEWKCSPEEFDAEIYVCFEKGGTFELFQKIGEGRHRRYSGTWVMNGRTLSGFYSEGTEWGSTYIVDFIDVNTITLTAQNGSEEVFTYFKESVPSDVREGSVDVRSEAPGILNSQPQYRWL